MGEFFLTVYCIARPRRPTVTTAPHSLILPPRSSDNSDIRIPSNSTMPTTRLRSRNTAGPEPEKARDSGIDSALTGHPPSGGNGNTTTNHTDRKRSVGEALSDSEGDAPTKKSQKSALKGRDARQRRKHEAPAASVTPPKGPRKRTNEHPGLIGKKP